MGVKRGFTGGIHAWLLGLFLLLLQGGAAFATEERGGNGLLFRVHAPGGAVSYLFGTIHSEDRRVLTLPRPVREAFESSRLLAIEVKPDAALLLASMSVMVYSDGRDLQSVVGDEIFRRCVEAMAPRGVPEAVVRQFKPWTLATMLSVPPAETGEFLDFMLNRLAIEQGREVIGLETVQEQLEVFDGMDEADQVALLVDTLNNLDELPMLNQQLLEAYLERDLRRLAELSEQSMELSGEGLSQRIQERVVDDRNRKMAERIEALLHDGGVFVAVGALHLPGREGLLQLVREKGFGVELVY
ncbi:MAG: TraB/GumN family protein [Sedimenticola sp.]